jgi:hypothetical protein
MTARHARRTELGLLLHAASLCESHHGCPRLIATAECTAAVVVLCALAQVVQLRCRCYRYVMMPAAFKAIIHEIKLP